MRLLPQTPRLTTKPPVPGIYTNVPAEQYHSWRAVSSGLLRTLYAETASHARAYMDGGDDPTAEMIAGGAYHAMVLEPEKFAAEYVEWSGVSKSSKEGKAEYAAALEKVRGDETKVISKIDRDGGREIGTNTMRLMHQKLRAAMPRQRLVDGARGESEVCVVWGDVPTGLVCKARIDRLYRDVVAKDSVTQQPRRCNVAVDLKTTLCAARREFCGAIAQFGYDIQAAMYRIGLMAHTQLPTDYFLLAQEKYPPYEPAIWDASDERSQPSVIACGEWKFRYALDQLSECLITDRWPGYPEQPQTAVLPTWAIPEALLSGR